jgi:hypothetical protein
VKEDKSDGLTSSLWLLGCARLQQCNSQVRPRSAHAPVRGEDVVWEIDMRIIAPIIVFLLVPICAFGDTHYVSPYGNDTPPYDSWTTAADSIQKGIDAASSGDTVRVGAGTYYEGVVLKPYITLLGAGMDSCIINGNIPSEPSHIVDGADSSVVEGLHVIGRGYDFDGGVGIYSTLHLNLKEITDNRVTSCRTGIYAGGYGTVVSNNISSNNVVGIDTDPTGFGLIINNTITDTYFGINLFFGSGYRITKNIIAQSRYNAVSHYVMDSIFVQNNLITQSGVGSIILKDGWASRANVENNTILANPDYWGILVARINAEVTNNIIQSGLYGVKADSLDCYVVVSHNDFWGNAQNYSTSGGAVIDTSSGGNIYTDPMFADPDGDFHLQKYSPCIDAGDPNVKDPDSSRSDIGCYGGLYGETYSYLDLAPKAPDSLAASFDSVTVTINWKPNSEADLSHYTVYKDTLFGFTPDSSKIVGTVSKDSSSFKDYDWEYGETYYYRLSAWDLTNNQSPYSDELVIQATDVPWTDETETQIAKYKLSQNYPNPFNPNTVIVYYLPDVGYQPAEVELTIYSVLGRVVRTLVKARQHPGEHRAVWDGKDDQGKDVASGIYFYRLKVSGIEFVGAKKMLLLR